MFRGHYHWSLSLCIITVVMADAIMAVGNGGDMGGRGSGGRSVVMVLMVVAVITMVPEAVVMINVV